MAIVNKLAAVATALLLVLAGPTSAFTPNGPVVETNRSNISTLWQPAVAEYKDTIYEACEGFKYRMCIQEFVNANRDKFPEKAFPKEWKKEKDFWVIEGVQYYVPLFSGAKAGAVQKSQPGSQPTMVEIMNGFSATQQEMADKLASLSQNFGTLAVRDIDGLGEALAEVRQQTQEFTQVQAVVQRLEQAYTDLHNGELTTGMLNAIQAANETDLQPILDDIAALQQADITFNERLDAVEAEVAAAGERLPTTVQAEVDKQLTEQLPSITDDAVKAAQTEVGKVEQAQSWYNILFAIGALVIALLAVGSIFWMRRSSKATKALAETVASNEKQLNGDDGLVKKHEKLKTYVHEVADKHEKLSAFVHDEDEGLAATRDLAETAISQHSTLTFLDTPDLKCVNTGATSRWVMTTGDGKEKDLQTFEVHFTKRAEDGLFDWSVPRNQDGTGESQPIAYKSQENMKTKLRQAHINGRLKHCDVRLPGRKKQKKTEPEKAPA